MHSNTEHELGAVQTVHQTLVPLTPEARGRVLQAVTALLEIEYPKSNFIPSADGGSSNAIQNPAAIETSLQGFIVSKNPQGLSQRLACLAYFLEHHRKMVDFTSKDLTQANSDARQPRIGDTGRELSTATRRDGFFSDAGKHKKRLTPRGSAVVEALPDQEAVKKALREHPFKRKTPSRAKKN